MTSSLSDIISLDDELTTFPLEVVWHLFDENISQFKIKLDGGWAPFSDASMIPTIRVRFF